MRYILSIELFEFELDDEWPLPGRWCRRWPADDERLAFFESVRVGWTWSSGSFESVGWWTVAPNVTGKYCWARTASDGCRSNRVNDAEPCDTLLLLSTDVDIIDKEVVCDRSLSGDIRTSSAMPVGDDTDQPFVDDDRASMFFEKSKWFSNFKLFGRQALGDWFKSFDTISCKTVTPRLFKFLVSLATDPFVKSATWFVTLLCKPFSLSVFDDAGKPAKLPKYELRSMLIWSFWEGLGRTEKFSTAGECVAPLQTGDMFAYLSGL